MSDPSKGRKQRRSASRAGVLALLALLCGCVSDGAGSLRPGPVAGPAAGQAAAGEEWLIPSRARGYMVPARVFRPAGEGPFPLAVINHGSEQDPVRRRALPAPSFPALTGWFLERGYVVVVPTRPGHGSGGPYLEDQRGCRNADYRSAGNGAADSIAATIDFMRRQPFVRQGGTVVAGHSAGGWGGLAYAARNPAGIRAVVNFSGGRGGHDLDRPLSNCAPERLVAAAGEFGGKARIPTLWLYAENDTYFPPALSRAMAAAFRDAGGRAEFHLFPAHGAQGHALVHGTQWSEVLRRFLDGAAGA